MILVWRAPILRRMIRASIIAALVALTAASPALGAHHRWTSPRLLHRWTILNDRCRAGDDQTACAERTQVEDALFARGYCYVGGASRPWKRGLALQLTGSGDQAVCHR
jgi:hypothetical protein